MITGNKQGLQDHGDVPAAGEGAVFQQCQLCSSLLHGMVPVFCSFAIQSCLLNIVLAALSSCSGDKHFIKEFFPLWQEMKHFAVSLEPLHTFVVYLVGFPFFLTEIQPKVTSFKFTLGWSILLQEDLIHEGTDPVFHLIYSHCQSCLLRLSSADCVL